MAGKDKADQMKAYLDKHIQTKMAVPDERKER